MQELLRFTYEGSELCLFKDKDKLKYGKRIGEELTFKLSLKEKSILDTIVVQIMPSSNLLNMGKITFKKKEFQHFLDIKKSWHVFYELRDNQFLIPNENDQVALNQIFNEQEGIVYGGSESNDKKEGFVKRVVKLGSSLAIVYVVATIGFYSAKLPFFSEDALESKSYPVISFESLEEILEDEHIVDNENSEEKSDFRFIEIIEEEQKKEVDELIFSDLVLNVYGLKEAELSMLEEVIPYPYIQQIENRRHVIERAIGANKFLSDDEKDFLRNNYDLFSYVEDLELEELESRLRKISFLYDPFFLFGSDGEYWNRFLEEDRYKVVVNAGSLAFADLAQVTRHIGDVVNRGAIFYQKEEDILDKAQVLMNTLKNNPHLSLKEKELFLSNENIFRDALEDSDVGVLLKQLQKLSISYVPNNSSESSVRCYYDYISGVIYVYGSNHFNESLKPYLTHEFCHVLTNFQHYFWGSSIYECLNVKMNNEYYGESRYDYDQSYGWNTNEVRLLGEIVGPDIVARYRNNPNPSILITALYKIYPDTSKIMKLVDNFDFINKAYMKNLDLLAEVPARVAENHELLRMFYEAKFNRSVDEIYGTVPFGEDNLYLDDRENMSR